MKAEISVIEAQPSYVQIIEEFKEAQEKLFISELISQELDQEFKLLRQNEKDIIDQCIEVIPLIFIKENMFEDVDITYIYNTLKHNFPKEIPKGELILNIQKAISRIITKAL